MYHAQVDIIILVIAVSHVTHPASRALVRELQPASNAPRDSTSRVPPASATAAAWQSAETNAFSVFRAASPAFRRTTLTALPATGYFSTVGAV